MQRSARRLYWHSCFKTCVPLLLLCLPVQTFPARSSFICMWDENELIFIMAHPLANHSLLGHCVRAIFDSVMSGKVNTPSHHHDKRALSRLAPVSKVSLAGFSKLYKPRGLAVLNSLWIKIHGMLYSLSLGSLQHLCQARSNQGIKPIFPLDDAVNPSAGRTSLGASSPNSSPDSPSVHGRYVASLTSTSLLKNEHDACVGNLAC